MEIPEENFSKMYFFSLFQHIPSFTPCPSFILLCFLVLHHSLQACLNPHVPLFSGGVIVSIHWRNHYSLLAVSITKDSQKDMMFVFHHTFFRCQVVFLPKREEFGLKMTSFIFSFFCLIELCSTRDSQLLQNSPLLFSSSSQQTITLLKSYACSLWALWFSVTSFQHNVRFEILCDSVFCVG